MLMRRDELPLLLVNSCFLLFFGTLALRRSNHEFVLYAGVVLVIICWVVWKQRTVRFDKVILYGLSAWGLLHMAGGTLQLWGTTLYNLQLIPVVLRYDQFVHTLGFGTVTLVCHHLLLPHLKPQSSRRWLIRSLVVLMGCGVGALNEIVEFIAVKTVPETNVGGYDNTLFDLVFNLIGAVLAVGWLSWRDRRIAHQQSNARLAHD